MCVVREKKKKRDMRDSVFFIRRRNQSSIMSVLLQPLVEQLVSATIFITRLVGRLQNQVCNECPVYLYSGEDG